MYGQYQEALLLIMEINNFCLIPNYPFSKSLDELENTKEIEEYCYKVLGNLNELIKLNEEL